MAEAAGEVALPLTGGCVCGAVRYRLAGAPLLVYACHCHDCQTRSGAAFSLTAVVRAADLSVEGEVATRRRTTPSGRVVEDRVCAACGVPMMACAPAEPGYASLRVGTLDDAGWAVPVVQMWVESAIPWAVIPGVAHAPPGPIDFYALGEAWRVTAPRFGG